MATRYISAGIFVQLTRWYHDPTNPANDPNYRLSDWVSDRAWEHEANTKREKQPLCLTKNKQPTNLVVPAHTNDPELASLVPQTPASLTGGRHAYKVPEQGAKEGAVSSA